MDTRGRVAPGEEVQQCWPILSVLSFWNFTLGHKFGREILRKPLTLRNFKKALNSAAQAAESEPELPELLVAAPGSLFFIFFYFLFIFIFLFFY